jgi:hypothetical protein
MIGGEEGIMTKHKFCFAVILLLFFFPVSAIPGLARGDMVIPQVADGPEFHTKFDLINVSSRQSISNSRLHFLDQNGKDWSLSILMGNTLLTGSSFALNLAPRQTLRVETLGKSPSTASGYAVIEDNEPGWSNSPQDYALGISVYYEVYSGGRVVDTVSVPVGDPTSLGTFPVQIDQSAQLLTGIAIVNRSAGSNPMTINLFSADGSSSGSATVTLTPGQQKAEFLHEHLFQGLSTFKGMAEFVCDGPVAILALLQTQTSNGVQYATLVPVNKEALRPNSTVILPQATTPSIPVMPLDVDTLTVDYFRMRDSNSHEDYSWDLTYEYTGSDVTARYLKAAYGAAISPLSGDYSSSDAFDSISLTSLKSLNFSTAVIDLSDRSGNLRTGFAFAVKTEEGRYAKARIRDIYLAPDASGNQFKDLFLEVYVFK